MVILSIPAVSIKNVHLFFIATAILLAVGCGVWGVWASYEDAKPGYFTFGTVSFGVAAGLAVYGLWFFRKIRQEGLR